MASNIFQKRREVTMTIPWTSTALILLVACVSSCSGESDQPSPPLDTGEATDEPRLDIFPDQFIDGSDLPAADPDDAPDNEEAADGPETDGEYGIPGGAWICWIKDADLNLKREDLEYVALHYDVYRDQNGTLTAEQIDRLHELNPNLKILRYRTHSAVCGPENWGPLVTQHPGWWLRSEEELEDAEDRERENGIHKIVTWREDGCKVLKPNIRATRDFVWSIYEEELEKDYDGIFADISGPGVWRSNFRPQPPETPIIDPDPDRGGNYTKEEWIADQIGRLIFLKERLGDKLHLWNPIPYNWDSYENTKHFWEESDSDGAQYDGFLNTRDLGEDQWIDAVNILADAVRTGQIILVKTKNLDQSLAERKNIETFSFASYLLAISSRNDNSAYFCNCYDREPDTWENELASIVEDTRPHVEIGNPIQDSDESGNTYVQGFKIQYHASYRRNFEHGTVIVNPTADEDKDIVLGAIYLDGSTEVASIDLPAHDAKILAKAPSE
jgi:hypothetical protein